MNTTAVMYESKPAACADSEIIILISITPTNCKMRLKFEGPKNDLLARNRNNGRADDES